MAGLLFRAQASDHTLQPTALVHEAYVKLVKPQDPGKAWNGRDHFFRVASTAMRQVLVSHARARNADKRGGSWQRVTLDAAELPDRTVDIIALEEALSALEHDDPRQCRIVEMRFFGGLCTTEIARVLQVSERTVQLELKLGIARLRVRLEDQPA